MNNGTVYDLRLELWKDFGNGNKVYKVIDNITNTCIFNKYDGVDHSELIRKLWN